jgi:predicted Zn-dependent protease
MDRLYPELDRRIRVRVLNSPQVNAFALPNGSVYVNLGLLARADNEAQLATVLAHEGAHFVQRHGWRQRRTLKSASVFALGVALAGIPLVGDLIAVSSMYGYSRELEREADAVGSERLLRAGFSVIEGARMFAHLHAEMQALDEDEPVFFASHPRLKERIEVYRELAAQPGGAGGGPGRADFLALTAGLRLACLETDLELDRYASLLLVLQSESAAVRYPDHLRSHYLGEALQRRGGAGDAQAAVQAWQAALASEPRYAPAHRALGLHYLKAGRTDLARPLLERYLELVPLAADRAYIDKYLEEMKP